MFSVSILFLCRSSFVCLPWWQPPSKREKRGIENVSHTFGHHEKAHGLLTGHFHIATLMGVHTIHSIPLNHDAPLATVSSCTTSWSVERCSLGSSGSGSGSSNRSCTSRRTNYARNTCCASCFQCSRTLRSFKPFHRCSTIIWWRKKIVLLLSMTETHQN